MPTYENREAWLIAALAEIRDWFAQTSPSVDVPATVRVSCGWSKRSGKGIGWCWKSDASKDGTNEILISPEVDGAFEVLGILVHEAIHASDNGESKHSGYFRTTALAIGLEGKMTATTVGTALESRIRQLVEKLGPYPHAAINPGMSIIPKQSTRMLKLECPGCGYVARTTQKWLDVGVPTCPCGTEMESA
jgi:hypothetical protein